MSQRRVSGPRILTVRVATAVGAVLAGAAAVVGAVTAVPDGGVRINSADGVRINSADGGVRINSVLADRELSAAVPGDREI